MVTPVKLPIKKLILLNCALGEIVNIVSVNALKKLDTAMPDNIIVIRDAPVFRAIPYTNKTAHRAPKNAANGVWLIKAGKNVDNAMVNNPAPALTPMMFGLAKELFKTVCKIAPETDNATPVNIAAMVRGSRTK